VLGLRRRGSRAASDERILGSSEFVEGLVRDVETVERETLRFRGGMKRLDELIREVCEQEGLSEEELRSGRRSKRVTKARRAFCKLAVKGMGYGGAEVVRYLGVTTSAVNRAARLESRPESDSEL
jgi:putative transposase